MPGPGIFPGNVPWAPTIMGIQGTREGTKVVEIAQYHKMRRAVQVNASPGPAHELRAVQADLRAALTSVGLFEEVEVEYTDDLDQLVIAMFTYSDQLSNDEVVRHLELMWEDRLRFPFWEAHTVLVDKNQVEFEGATRASSTGHYVTVHIVAQRAHFPAQRTAGSVSAEQPKVERDRKSMPGILRRRPQLLSLRPVGQVLRPHRYDAVPSFERAWRTSP